jgi:carbamoyl-phosphate synthase small subunit
VENLMNSVSIKKPLVYGTGKIRIALLDCGCKHNIVRSLLKRGVQVLRVPWDCNLIKENFDGLLVSNGPGNPKMCRTTISRIHQTIERDIPTFGICLGNQLMALAAGANTYKLKYGHRSQNQPVIENGTNRCLITSQNHGFAVDNHTLPEDWYPWFTNLNDGTNEGIRHVSGRFRSVQFHPEAAPGPVDAGYLFDEFLEIIRK